MAKRTIDIRDSLLGELRQIQAREGKSLDRLIGDLLAEALVRRRSVGKEEQAPPMWISRPMGARVDLDDKEALQRLLAEEHAG